MWIAYQEYLKNVKREKVRNKHRSCEITKSKNKKNLRIFDIHIISVECGWEIETKCNL